MTLLHDYFNTRNLQAFQRLLDGCSVAASGLVPNESSSARSAGNLWNRECGLTGSPSHSPCDVNTRDWLGRTVLHLACASLESIEYVRALLKHPNIDVNLPDMESRWTPLHRALYSANLPAVLILLQCPDINPSLQDLEGYTAFDLYNSTLPGTKPDKGDAELYTWGVNKNAALAVGDGNDRMYPERILIKSKEDPTQLLNANPYARLSHIPVRQIRMSKLHTAVITADSEGNLRLCGFGSGGRLHTQYALRPLSSFNLHVQSVALGQDHTLALTKSGEVYSWGLNRFSQLGYAVDGSTSSSTRYEEPIQCVPKKVVGLLKKEIVRGVAASRNASACWTKDTVFTWGTNTGQLGYDRIAQPIQVFPRPVTKFTNTVIDLAMSDTVLTALLVTGQVECIWNDRHIRINFPMQFPMGIQPYRPPQCVKDAHIVKITCCDENFAALSSNGEVFTFSPSSDGLSVDTRATGSIFKPQKVWALRKKFTAVKDVALGSDGGMVICTESGHVYVRTKNIKNSNKAFRYIRVPFLQRVTQVCANSTGAFAALRVDHRPNPIELMGKKLAQDLKALQPYLQFYRSHMVPGVRILTLDDEDPEDAAIESDIGGVLELLDVLFGEQQLRAASGGNIKYDGTRLPHDADVMIYLHTGQMFPVHRAILVARSPVMETFLAGSCRLEDVGLKLSVRLMPPKLGPGLGVPKLTYLMICGCHPLTVLILLRYLYSDELVAIWDRRVSTVVQKQLKNSNTNPSQVKLELQALAKLFDLPVLSQALDHPIKHDPVHTIAQDMQRLFDIVQSPLPVVSPLAPDVVIQLADKVVYTHSILLRARTSLFASFFDLEDWTVKRWESDGTIRLNFCHLSWHVMRFVLKFMCGSDQEMFDDLDFVDSVDDLLEFMFEVAAAANELLLDRLILICASIILAHCNLQNACSILVDATYYQIQPLIESVREYMAINMEALLQVHMLDQIPYAVVKQLAKYVKARQQEKSPFSRSDAFVNGLLKEHAAWLEERDIPGAIVRTTSDRLLKKNGSGTKMLPTTKTSFTTPTNATLPLSSGKTLRRPPSGNDIFIMDDLESTDHHRESVVLANAPSPPTWKPTTIPRVDMKTIMAETQAERKPQSSPGPSRSACSRSAQRPQKLIVGIGMPKSSDASNVPRFARPGSSSAWSTNLDQPGTRATTQLTLDTSSAPRPTGPTRAQAQTSGLGPIITPKRQMHPSSDFPNARSSGSGKAWSLPPGQSPAKSTPATAMSFAAIQDSQKQIAPTKDVRSFREIQEEEQSLQVEADFLKWWTAEEERVRQEALALVQFENALNDTSKSSSPKNDTKSKRKGTPALASNVAAPESGSSRSTQQAESNFGKQHGYQRARRKHYKLSQVRVS